MSTPQTIREGQRWRSRDRRDNGAEVLVVRVGNEHVVVDGKSYGGKRRSMKHATLRGRYELVSGFRA